MFAIASLLAVVAVSLVITRVATVILVASGMSRESARFQARSAFTGAGFTTTESEDVVAHPLRRRVVMTLMLLGNAGIVAAASGLILGFRGGASGNEALRVLALVAGLLAIVSLSRNRHVDRRLTAGISRLLHEHTDLPGQNSAHLLELPEDRVVAELAVREGDRLAGRTLADLRLRQHGATVLGVQPPGAPYRDDISGATTVTPGDTLILYTDRTVLRDLDARPAPPPGGATGSGAGGDPPAA